MKVFTLSSVLALTASLAVSVAVASNTAQRDGVFATFEYAYSSGVGEFSDASANGYALSVGGSPLSWLDLELKNEFTTASLEQGSVFDFGEFSDTLNQLEGSAKAYYGINNNFGLFTRAAVGQAWVSGASDFTYGSIEPGVYYAPFGQSNPTNISVSYRYRDSFNDNIEFRTNSGLLTGEYAINSRDSVVAGYEYVDGDQSFNQIRIGYRARF